MTAQVPDSLTIDGRRWAIKNWVGDSACVPTNDDFGLVTTSPSTNNRAGRIDHFMVFQGHLYLFKVEISLAPDFDRARLAGRRREVLCRYEPMTRFDNTGHHSYMKEWRFEYLVLDDCRVSLTGELQLEFPYGDGWEVPTLKEVEEVNPESMTLTFERGVLVG